MSYLFVVVIGAVVGALGSQFLKASEHGVGLDIAIGGMGAVLIVLLSRFVSPASSGLVMSAIIAIIGSIGTLFIARRFMGTSMVTAKPRRR